MEDFKPEYQRQINAQLVYCHSQHGIRPEIKHECDLQTACEQWLDENGYRRLTPENAVLEGNPVGWYGHLPIAKKQPQMPDLFIFDGKGRCLMVELKTEVNGKIHFGIGQRQQCERKFWQLVTTFQGFQEAIKAW